jgi:hypothetical protein
LPKARLIQHLISHLPLSTWSNIMTDTFQASTLLQGIGPDESRNLLRYVPLAVRRANQLLKALLGDDPIVLLMDETPLWRGTGAVCMYGITWQHQLCLQVKVLDGEATMSGESSAELVEELVRAYGISHSRLRSVGGDNVAYNGKAFRLLQAKHRHLTRIQCIPHTLNLVLGQLVRPEDWTLALQFAAALRSYLVPKKGVEYNGRCKRFIAMHLTNPRGPLDYVETRWGTRNVTCIWILDHARIIRAFLISEAVCS